VAQKLNATLANPVISSSSKMLTVSTSLSALLCFYKLIYVRWLLEVVKEPEDWLEMNVGYANQLGFARLGECLAVFLKHLDII